MSFQLDPFQIKAIEHIDRGESVLVSAPTGAGKTVIAERAIEHAMNHREKVIYTAPIKTLSNQKYRDFRAVYGEDNVGIVTGDVTINSDAPIVIMTTEIYRNALFESGSRTRNVRWVIFDEIHYLDDAERGTVWEEAILFSPPEIRILGLSATVPNIDELAEWMGTIHGEKIAVVKETHRPVPLDFIFQCQGKFFDTEDKLKRFGYLNRENWGNDHKGHHKRHHRHQRHDSFLKARPNRIDHMIEYILEKDHLPAIYFTFSRRRTEELASEASQFDFLDDGERKELITLYEELLDRYKARHEASADELRPYIELGIAYHHAGMLPTLKEIVEQLFTSRLIKMIFTTETFALGINMPARCVVFDELQKFYGTGFKNLTTRDFFQMAGRAGRRGMDKRGIVMMRINPQHISLPEVRRIIFNQPEAIQSQLNTAYATLLNLYRDLGQNLLDIYPQSLHYFQYGKKERKLGKRLIENKLNLLGSLGHITQTGLTPKGEFAASLFGYELILSEMHADGVLDELNEAELCMLLAGLIFEPRKNQQFPIVPPQAKKLLKMAQHYHRLIHKEEKHNRVYPYTMPPHFHLARAVHGWVNGKSFEDILELTPADEGEIVRYLRMVIQLLRELNHASHATDRLKATTWKALDKINRDVVDAEKQLRI